MAAAGTQEKEKVYIFDDFDPQEPLHREQLLSSLKQDDFPDQVHLGIFTLIKLPTEDGTFHYEILPRFGSEDFPKMKKGGNAYVQKTLGHFSLDDDGESFKFETSTKVVKYFKDWWSVEEITYEHEKCLLADHESHLIPKDESRILILKDAGQYDLNELLNKPEELNLELRIKIMLELVKALIYFHSKNLRHRDIKPSNIMIDRHSESLITFIDFDSIVQTEQRDGETYITGHDDKRRYDIIATTPVFVAPEVATAILENGGIEPESDEVREQILQKFLDGDRFSLAGVLGMLFNVLLYEKREPPDDVKVHPEKLYQNGTKGYEFDWRNFPRECAPYLDNMKEIIEGLGNPDPTQRMSLEEALQKIEKIIALQQRIRISPTGGASRFFVRRRTVQTNFGDYKKTRSHTGKRRADDKSPSPPPDPQRARPDRTGLD